MQWLIDIAKSAMRDELEEFERFEPSAYFALPTYDQNLFAQDGAYHTTGTLSKIPVDAKVALFNVTWSSIGTGQELHLDRVTNVNGYTEMRIFNAVEYRCSTKQFLLDVTISRQFRYKITNGPFTYIWLQLLGSFK